MAGLFALINNKKENDYLYLFQRIKDILTIKNTIKLEIESYNVDLEKGLINALNIIFPEIKSIGCYFHYTRVFRKKSIELRFGSKDKSKIIEPLLKELYRLPFIFYKDNNKINTICQHYTSQNNDFTEFINYFKNEWFQYYENGLLDYSEIKKNMDLIVI